MGTPRGWGGGSSAVATLLIDRPRPHPITAQPLLSPSLAGPRVSAAPGTRHQIGVKIPRVSFAAVDGADNRDRLAGGKQRRRGGFSIKASPSALGRGGQAGESAALVQAGCVRELGAAVTGSEDATSRAAGWRTHEKSQLAALQNCAVPRACLFPSLFTVRDPKSPAADQKGRPLLSYLLSEQNPTEAKTLTPYPEEPGRASPRRAQALLEAWPMEVLRARLHCPCTPSRTTTTTATSQLCCPHHHCSSPLQYQPPQHTALTVPSSISITTQHWSRA